MLDRVFIVTHGSYSNYGISSVWTTREAAEREAGEPRDVDMYGPWIEEWILNEGELRPNITWTSRLTREQEVVVDERPTDFQEVQQTHVRWNRDWNGWVGWGYGASPEHARKNLADALAKANAEHANQA